MPISSGSWRRSEAIRAAACGSHSPARRTVLRPNWDSIVSDTTDNPVSANNFIQAGYRLYEPEVPWAWSHTLYWRKRLR
ncbi:hypothetical protein ABIF57_000819 [Bradyrhizobium diazoefficiens]